MYESSRGRATSAVLGLCLAVCLCCGAGRVSAVKTQPEKLVPVGHTVGIKLFSRGVLVVGLSTADGTENSASPAKAAGLKAGDVILAVDGVSVESTAHLQQLLKAGAGKEQRLRIQRKGRERELFCRCLPGEDGSYRLGAWIRDSIAGIGTVTFYDPESGTVGALGHGVTDVDTGQLIPLSSGALMPSTVKAVKKGEEGSPGELRGEFDLTEDLGQIFANTEQGIFATVEAEAMDLDRAAVEVADKEEVRPGPATILSNVSGDQVREYQVEIEKVCLPTGGRNMVLRITDPQLLSATGGIVQGMSGSPILQNGKLVGAVTHVLVDDPTRGYGIFIENMTTMLEAAA